MFEQAAIYDDTNRSYLAATASGYGSGYVQFDQATNDTYCGLNTYCSSYSNGTSGPFFRSGTFSFKLTPTERMVKANR